MVSGALAATLVLGVASARAESPIEGIWSFNGGKVGIQAQPGGTFVGTVVAPTKFAQCTHPVGEQMWTDMRRQPDESYWGLHQWFFATEACIANPVLGSTAWRVLRTSDGSRFLRACFSEPGSGSQPTIAPDGTSAGATYGCVDSAHIAPLPTVKPAQFEKYVTLPSSKGCLSRSKLRIQVRDPKSDPFTKIHITLESGKVRRRAKLHRHGATTTATLNLRHLPTLTFTVSIRLTTALGNHLSRKRTYRLCAGKVRHRRRAHPRS